MFFWTIYIYGCKFICKNSFESRFVSVKYEIIANTHVYALRQLQWLLWQDDRVAAWCMSFAAPSKHRSNIAVICGIYSILFVQTNSWYHLLIFFCCDNFVAWTLAEQSASRQGMQTNKCTISFFGSVCMRAHIPKLLQNIYCKSMRSRLFKPKQKRKILLERKWKNEINRNLNKKDSILPTPIFQCSTIRVHIASEC